MKRGGDRIALNRFEAWLCDGVRSFTIDEALTYRRWLCQDNDTLTERIIGIHNPEHAYGESCQILLNEWLIGRFGRVLGEIAVSEPTEWPEGPDGLSSE